MLRAGTLSKPRGKPSIDLLLVCFRVVPTQVLAHQPHSDLEQIERLPERSRGDRRGG
jgi:hypothetical protein